MTRREMREYLFCLVFQNEFYPAEEFTEQRDNFLQGENAERRRKPGDSG